MHFADDTYLVIVSTVCACSICCDFCKLLHICPWPVKSEKIHRLLLGSQLQLPQIVVKFADTSKIATMSHLWPQPVQHLC